MKPIGAKLRAERIRKGMSLSEIAAELRISSRYLTAIEEDDWGQLPGDFFGRSFVRQYAAAVGLHPNQFEADLEAQRDSDPEINAAALVAVPKPAINVPPMPTVKGRFWDSKAYLSAAALVVVVLGCSGLLTVWQRAAPPSPAAKAPPVADAKRDAAPLTAHEVIPRPLTTPGPSGESPVNQTPLKATVTPSVAPATAPTPPPSGPVAVVYSAVEQTWVEVSSDGHPVFTGVMQPGESKSVSGNQNARVLVGNAAGLTIQFNGKNIGPVGGRGEVRRVHFTSDSFQVVQPQIQAKPATD